MPTVRHEVLYVGVDVHKDTHTAVATTCYGDTLFEKVVGNTPEATAELIAAVRQTALVNRLTPVFGLEDSYGYGSRLARRLFQAGLTVKTVSPVLVDRERHYETHPEKSDSLDALAAAKVLIQRIDRLPAFSITQPDELANEISELSLDREFLVKEQARIKNQLHRLLHKAYNSSYRERFKDPFSVKALKYWARRPVPADRTDILGDPTVLKNQIKRKVRRLIQIREERLELGTELAALIAKTGQQLETLNGCGTTLAAYVLAEVKNITRFHSPSALAKYAGLAPKEKSSGKSFRHVKSKAGNRRLNMAIHRIALSQISRSGNEKAKAYFQRKISEGKNKSQALCCLKRRLVDIIYMMLKHKQPYRHTD